MSIYREGKVWRYEFQVAKVRYTRSGFKTKAEALVAREAHKKEIAKPQTPTGMVFSEAVNEYLDYCQRRYSPKTYKEKRFIYRCFMGHAGNLPLHQISPRTLENYLATRPSNANYNKHRKSLAAFLSWCHRRGLVTGNISIHVGLMPHQPARKQIPSQEEMVKLLLASGPWRPFLLALYSLAGRLGEINRLRWEFVNFERRQVTLWTRKGDGSYRPQVKPLNDELYEELRRLYTKNSGEWVFPNPDTGLPYVDRRKQLKRICRDANIPCLGFHSIRHYVASLLADTHKVSLPTIQKMLGHSRLTTTQGYIQSLGEGMRDAADKLQIFTNYEEPHTQPHEPKKEEVTD